MRARPVEESTAVELTTAFPALGRLKLWVPEAISSNTGASAAYPVGSWLESGEGLQQRVDPDDCFGPGNCERIDANTLECCDIRFPVDQPVEWETTLRLQGEECAFTIRLTNLGDSTLWKAAAPICLRFLDPHWWSDEAALARANGRIVSLAELGRNAGQPNTFQAYLVLGQTYDHVFYREFWGFNECRLDAPMLVSEHAEAGVWVAIEAEQAYFMHSNRGNPCTDLMLAFGDVGPGHSAEAGGAVRVGRGRARDILEGLR